MTNDKETQLHPLFVKALAGDQQAYAILLRRIAEFVQRYTRRKLQGSADRDDVAQEVLISIHKALHTYDPTRPCVPWLAAIIEYRLKDWFRRHYSRMEDKKVPLEDVQEFLLNDVTEEPLAYEYVHKAVQMLSVGQQAVLHAMYQEDMTVRETSEKLGMSVSSVKVTAHRAYKALRKRLENV